MIILRKGESRYLGIEIISNDGQSFMIENAKAELKNIDNSSVYVNSYNTSYVSGADRKEVPLAKDESLAKPGDGYTSKYVLVTEVVNNKIKALVDTSRLELKQYYIDITYNILRETIKAKVMLEVVD